MKHKLTKKKDRSASLSCWLEQMSEKTAELLEAAGAAN